MMVKRIVALSLVVVAAMAQVSARPQTAEERRAAFAANGRQNASDNIKVPAPAATSVDFNKAATKVKQIKTKAGAMVWVLKGAKASMQLSKNLQKSGVTSAELKTWYNGLQAKAQATAAAIIAE